MDFNNDCIFRPTVEQYAVFLNILQTVVLCTTLKPNGKLCGNFVILNMGLTGSLKKSNTLNASPSSADWIYIYWYSTLHSLPVKTIENLANCCSSRII